MNDPAPAADALRVLIVDDEPPARERLGRMLAGFPEVAVVGEAGNGAEALEACARLLPDVVLLDIRMPGMDGIEAARHLNALEEPPAVVFVTAHDEHALAAFEAQALGYLLGYHKMRELRTRAETALGARFNVKDFHAVVIDNGSMPLAVLEKLVDEWIAGGGGRTRAH